MNPRFSSLTAFASALVLSGAFALTAEAQTTIAAQSFDASANTWAITAGATNSSTATGSGDTPASARIRTGTASFQTNNATNTVDLASQNTAGFSGIAATVRLSSTSATTGNGSDGSDAVQVFVALNGAAFGATPDVTVNGNNNARWDYAATGTATTTAGTPVTVAAPSGGTIATGIATITVNIPDGTTSVALRVVASNNSGNEIWNVDDIALNGTSGSAPESATVTFSPTSATTAENVPYTAGRLVYTLNNSDGDDSNNPAASGSGTITSGNAGEIATFSMNYSFATATLDGTNQGFSITPTDDMTFNADRDVTFELTPTTSMASGTFTLTITDDEAAPAVAQLVISEFMQNPDAVGDGDGEYFEVFNAGSTAIDMTGYTISDNGTDSHVIGSSVVVQPGAFAVLCNNSTAAENGGFACDYQYSGITLSNSADEIVLTDASANEVDRVEYDGGPNWPDGTGESAVFIGLASADNNVASNWALATVREPRYTGTVGDLGSPGTSGQDQQVGAAAPVTVTQDLGEFAGYRLLSTPVRNVTVNNLAGVNLIQGITAGATSPAQYDQAAPNIFTSYNAATSYTRPADTDVVIEPGRGFFWEFYNTRITVAQANSANLGTGTSESFPLDGTADLTATGVVLSSPVARTFPVSSDRFYMVGNPFDVAMCAASVTSNLEFQGNLVQAYSPMGGYVPIFRTRDGECNGTVLNRGLAMGREALPRWQGAFAEMTTADAPTFTYTRDANTPTAPAFIGREAIAGGVALELFGTTREGVATVDGAAFVRLSENALAGWDALDASKLSPPAGPYALVAPVTERDGAPYRLAVDTRPMEAATVPLHVMATDAGTYTLIVSNLAGIPEGWDAQLRDVVTGQIGPEHTFTTEATDWTNRFELVVSQRGSTAGENGPAVLSLSAPAPNPTTRRSTMSLTVDVAQHVTATVIDALGRTVATVFDADMAAGADAQITVDASALAPGIYVVRVAGETFAEARRITVAR